MKVLVDHTDAKADRVVRLVDLYWLAPYCDLSFIWRVKPIKDVHQGAFSSAVFAQKGQYLSLVQRKTNVVVG